MFKKYPGLFLLISICIGILFADIVRFSSFYFLFVLLVSGLTAVFVRNSKHTFLFPLLVGISFFSFAALRFAVSTYDFGSSHISQFTDGKTKYRIFGEINDWVDLKQERTEIRLQVDSLISDRVHKTKGNIQIRINVETTSFQRGDNLIIEGRIYPVRNRPFSADFDYQRFLSYKGIFGIVYLNTDLNLLIDKGNRYSIFRYTDKIRDWIRNTFYENLNPDAAALASGFLIGETRDIPPDLYQRFKDSGTLHLLAVSGSNVVLVIGFFLYLLRPFSLSKKRRTLILMGVLVLFVLLSYEEPSVIRASVMAGLLLLANLFERRYDLNNIISLAALLILLVAPSQLFNIGFQLSFLIAWGLILTLPEIAILFDKVKFRWWYRFLVFPFIVSFVAQIYSTGLVGLYFDRIPLLSPFANLIIVPLVSLSVIGIQLLLAANFILPIFGKFVGSLLTPLFYFTITSVELFGGEGMIFLNTVDWNILYVIIFYLILFYISANLTNKRARRRAILSVLITITIILAGSVYQRYQSRDKTFIEILPIVGGTMTILQHTEGTVDLVVQNIAARKYAIENKIIIPELTKRSVTQIDKLFVLSAEYNALDDMLRLVELYNIKEIYFPEDLENALLEVYNTYHGVHDSLLFSTLHPQASIASNGYSVLSSGLCFKLKQNILWFLSGEEKPIGDLSLKGRKFYLLNKISTNNLTQISFDSQVTVICAESEQETKLQSYKSSHNLLFEVLNLRESGYLEFEFPQ